MQDIPARYSTLLEGAYAPLNPGWCYDYVDVPNLDAVKAELMALRDIAPRTWYNKFYFNVPAPYVMLRCPTIVDWLSKLRLMSRLERVLYAHTVDLESPPHVDTVEPRMCAHSINIPLEKCDGSYTVWYKPERNDLLTLQKDPALVGAHFAVAAGAYEEVARVHCDRPYIANTTILHRGENAVDGRLLAGLRFIPPGLSHADLVRLGVHIPVG